MNDDRYFMKKALELARKGEGYTSPNPLVGAVVVKDKKIVGQGYHKFAGGPHAEVYALEEAGDKSKGAALYVNLEPCCHFGKTPPCTQKIIEFGIERVVIAVKDPNSLVAGKGIKELRQAGIKVKTGVMKEKAETLNEIFIKYITTDYPFVYLKAAQTLDGFLATGSGDSQWITNEKSRLQGHHLRHRVDAVLVGINTVINDNPRLTTRLPESPSQDSMRIILDSHLRIPPEADIVNHQSQAKTLIVTGAKVNSSKKNLLKSKEKVEVMTVPLNNEGKIPVKVLLKKLHKREITGILIEGGGRVNHSFLKAGMIDKVYIFIAPKIIGGSDGISVFSGKGVNRMKDVSSLKNVKFKEIDDNVLITGEFKN